MWAIGYDNILKCMVDPVDELCIPDIATCGDVAEEESDGGTQAFNSEYRKSLYSAPTSILPHCPQCEGKP